MSKEGRKNDDDGDSRSMPRSGSRPHVSTRDIQPVNSGNPVTLSLTRGPLPHIHDTERQRGRLTLRNANVRLSLATSISLTNVSRFRGHELRAIPGFLLVQNFRQEIQRLLEVLMLVICTVPSTYRHRARCCGHCSRRLVDPAKTFTQLDLRFVERRCQATMSASGDSRRLWTIPTAPSANLCLALPLIHSTTVLLSPLLISNSIPSVFAELKHQGVKISRIFAVNASRFFTECAVSCVIIFMRTLITSSFWSGSRINFCIQSSSAPAHLAIGVSHITTLL